jgi:hypothetical protein
VRRATGQATAEYVAILLVVATVLAGAGVAAAAAAVPGVGDRLVRSMRAGICIVGGDLCRSADAAAAGLPPCVTSVRTARQDTTIDVAVVRLGGHSEWQLALQSDGGAVVTRLEENEVGGTVGVGLTFSPVGIEGSASVAATVGYHSGRAWRFPDAATASAFLDGARRDAAVQAARRPDVRWDALAGAGSAAAGAAISDLARAGVSTTADGAIGLRRDGGRTTLTLDLGSEDPGFAVDLPGFPAPPAGVRTVIADVSWEAGAVRELALRAATAKGGRLEERTARLDLRDPASRALVTRLLRPGRTAGDLRAVMDRIASHGVVERAGYEVTERRRGLSVGGRLGVALGLSHERITAERRLTDAIAWVRGGPPQRRFDCLGV